MPAGAQQARSVHRIGYISSGTGPVASTETFRQALRELGYVEGQNLIIEYRWVGRGDRAAALTAELVGLNPNLIVSLTHAISLEVKRATTTIPVVFAQVNDPVGVGLVPSLAHPGGNVTGLSLQGLDLIAKRLELLKELLPAAFRVAYLGNPDEPYSPVYLREAQRAARILGLKEVFSIEARAQRDFDAALAVLTAKRPNALLVEPNGLNGLNRSRIVEFAIANRLPTMYGTRGGVDAGGLISYGPDVQVHHKRLAAYVDKILKGTRPVDLPVEQPTVFELVINAKTAKTIGVTVPQSLLLRADKVIG
jgi:putative ABC transport system substrate-binding protein